METALHGWICWVEGEVMAEENVLIASGKSIPKESELEDFGPYAVNSDGTQDGWSEQYVFHFYWEKEDLAFTLKLSSKSGLRAAKQLVRTYGKSYGVKIGADGDVQIPVIEIGSTSFDVKKEDGTINKKAGKKHAPVFKIVDWADKSEVAGFFEAAGGDDADDYDEGDDVPEDKPVGGRAAADTGRGGGRSRREEPADEPEDKPARGRGRSAPAEDADEPEDKPARGRGRGRSAPAEEPEDNGGDDGEDVPAEEPRGGGRRARVVHAEPQDDDEPGEQASSPRDSARGRRGRTRG
jgi:hypothetical protein